MIVVMSLQSLSLSSCGLSFLSSLLQFLPYGLGQMSLEALPQVTQHGLQLTASLIRLPAGSGNQIVPKPINSAVQLSGQRDTALVTPSFFPTLVSAEEA